MYYGARYYDPRKSVWQSSDPALSKYLPTGDPKRDKQLPGMGGIFRSANLNLFAYAHQNPVKYTDPNGRVVGIWNHIKQVSVGITLLRSVDAYSASFGSIGKFADKSGDKFVEKYGKNMTNDQKERLKNAVRHVVWQAKLTKTVGKKRAELIGNAHEAGEEKSKDSYMDQQNNKVGRRIGANSKNDKEIIEKVDKAYKKGKLLTDWNDPRIPKRYKKKQEKGDTSSSLRLKGSKARRKR